MTAFVPGCGRAYDAIALAEHGFESVVALDLSPSACEAARQELDASTSPAASRVEIRCGDFLALTEQRFDFIWDCTFLCALDPSVRHQWASQMRSLLTPSGELLTCVFPIGAASMHVLRALCDLKCSGEREGGPPYQMSVSLVRDLLEPIGLEAVPIGKTQVSSSPLGVRRDLICDAH